MAPVFVLIDPKLPEKRGQTLPLKKSSIYLSSTCTNLFKEVVGYFSPVWNSLCDKFSCFQGSVHGYPYENQKSIFFDRDKQTIL